MISNLVRSWEKAMNVYIDAWFAVLFFGLILLWKIRDRWVSGDGEPPTSKG